MEIADHKYDDGIISMKMKMLIPEEGGWSGWSAATVPTTNNAFRRFKSILAAHNNLLNEEVDVDSFRKEGIIFTHPKQLSFSCM
jgi:hypothetical protein